MIALGSYELNCVQSLGPLHLSVSVCLCLSLSLSLSLYISYLLKPHTCLTTIKTLVAGWKCMVQEVTHPQAFPRLCVLDAEDKEGRRASVGEFRQ